MRPLDIGGWLAETEDQRHAMSSMQVGSRRVGRQATDGDY